MCLREGSEPGAHPATPHPAERWGWRGPRNPHSLRARVHLPAKKPSQRESSQTWEIWAGLWLSNIAVQSRSGEKRLWQKQRAKPGWGERSVRSLLALPTKKPYFQLLLSLPNFLPVWHPPGDLWGLGLVFFPCESKSSHF